MFYQCSDNSKLDLDSEQISRFRNTAIAATVLNNTIDELMSTTSSFFILPNSFTGKSGIDEKQYVLTGNSTIRSGNIIGFIGDGTDYLQIYSRFAQSGASDYFSDYLIERTLHLPNLNFSSRSSTYDTKEYIHKLFVIAFTYSLKSIWNQGIYRHYETRHYHDTKIRGPIDIAKFIKLDTPFAGKIAYRSREYSADNFILELIRHTIEYIEDDNAYAPLLHGSKSTEHIIQTIRSLTPRYKKSDRAHIISINIKRTIANPYYSIYKQLQWICIRLLMHDGLSFNKSKSRAYGVLFDIAWLWEEYLNTLLSKSFFHPMNKERRGKQYLFSHGTGKIYPDFISFESQNRVIIDAKYKPNKASIHGDDYLQILAYMLRFDSKQGYFIHPVASTQQCDTISEEKLSLLSQAEIPPTGETASSRTDSITVHKIGLPIPQQSHSYTDFCHIMKTNEQRLVTFISGLS